MSKKISDPFPGKPYPTIQTTKINTEPFVFKQPKNVSYPASPLVTAKFYNPKDGAKDGPLTLKVRATLYINSKNPDKPLVETPKEEGNVLKINYDYDFSMDTPETCDVWYVELDYTSPTVKNITTIMSYMVNLDPETSRGTTTHVP
jgi:hypothetical protein